MIKHPGLRTFEKKLKKLFDGIDDYLEDNYGHLFPLHPRRDKRGATADKSADGLFNIGAAFSAGYGSMQGRGYVVEIRLATLENVSDQVRQLFRQEVTRQLTKRLAEQFSERDLRVVEDGALLKIIGDLSLD